MAPRGQLPTGTAIRRNKPTIPTTTLPAEGRQDPPPDIPATYTLGASGLDWWQWAWRTPQACAWDDGALFVVARRAKMEDIVAGLEPGESLAAIRETRELDDRLGLSPKGLAALRWKIVGDEATPASGRTTPEGEARRLKAV